MGNIPNLDTLVNKLTGGSGGNPQILFFYKDPFIGPSGSAPGTNVVGRWQSLWMFNGVPSGPSIPPPSTAAACNTQTTGSLMTYVNPQLNQNWILSVSANGLGAGMLMVYDRLSHISGLNATTTTVQTVSMSVGLGNITRYTGSSTCVGNQIWVEVYTAIGATAETINCTYINQNGVTQHTVSESIGGAGYDNANVMIQLPLAPGDTGVQAVNSVQLGTSTGTAGSFGITLLRPLVHVPFGFTGFTRDMVNDLPSIQFVEANACIAYAMLPNAATANQILGNIVIVEA